MAGPTEDSVNVLGCKGRPEMPPVRFAPCVAKPARDVIVDGTPEHSHATGGAGFVSGLTDTEVYT